MNSPSGVQHYTGITALFILLTGIMTWPQALVLGTQAVGDQDVFFNLWRLRWIAHALATSPSQLFGGNIFYPEQNVLAYSDAMLVQGVIAAPLLWVGLPPVLVHNLMLCGALVASGVGMYVLARHLTGNAIGAVAAGIVFVFAPFRFAHYIHLELQWTVWTPWAFWALQRAIETGRLKFGVLTGVFVALQLASSVYYGIFLALLVAVVALVQLVTLRGRHLVNSSRSLVTGGAIAALVAVVYSLPYTTAAQRVGTRSENEVTMFSARPRDYRVATPTNAIYGKPGVRSVERRLFPGILAPLLAVVGLLLVRPARPAIAYVIGLAVAFELSLGAYGLLYPLLYQHIPIFSGLRAPARAAVFCLLFLGVLAAYGIAALTWFMATSWRPVVGIAACVVLLVEYWVAPLTLTTFHNKPPALYAMLARMPRGIVAEFPMPRPGSPPHHDPRFAYMSTFHWMPLLNGYSGFYPPSYLGRLWHLRNFPDSESMATLRRERVRYVVVHADGYLQGERERIIARLVELGLKPLADFEDGWSVGTIMEMR